MRWLMDLGTCLMMEGGWFERLLMYRGSLFGFLYGVNLPLFKLRMMSRKLTIWWLSTSTVIFRPICLKTSNNLFLAISVSRPLVPGINAKPSSR